MKVKDLIEKLNKYDPELPVCIDDYMGFVEKNEETVKVEKHKYACFPFTENDEFVYVNLRGQKFD